MLTDDQAACIRVLTLRPMIRAVDMGAYVPQECWPNRQGGGQFWDHARAVELLAQYHAAQAAKRAAEIEAAYREGYHDHDWLMTAKETWAASETKKALEIE